MSPVMRTKIEAGNPYGWDRYGYAWQHVPAGGSAHLDYGCGDGRFLAGLAGKRLGRVVGVDVSRDAVQRAKVVCAEARVLHVDGQSSLPFADGELSSISLLDVLEHVDEQDALLGELHRVLRDEGILIVTVPGQHVFSILDMGNLKFRFPWLHRWFYCRRHGQSGRLSRRCLREETLARALLPSEAANHAHSQWLCRRRVRRGGTAPPDSEDRRACRGTGCAAAGPHT
jgi:SAM-dependent methyltransferase